MPRGRILSLLILPCLLLLMVTVPHLGQGDYRKDTGRYAAVGLYMWDTGNLLKPYLNPETPYFNKPPLAILVHGAFLKLFGPHLAVARIPSILAALGVLTLSVLTVRRIGSRSEAIVSGIVLALTMEFFRRTREISLDFWQLLFVMAAVYLVISGVKSNRKSLVVLAGIPIGLALLCKPLVALALLPLLAIWLAMSGRSRWIWLVGVGTLPAAILVALPWHLYMWQEFGSAFTNRYLMHEVVERAKGELSTNPPQYYFQLLGTTYWPWLAVIGFVLWNRWRGKSPRRPVGRDLVLMGGVWVVYTLGLITLFPDKKVNYILIVYPMLSWVVAAGLCRLPWRQLGAWYRSGFRWLAPAAVGLLILLSVLPIRFQAPPDKNWQKLFRWMETQQVAPGQMMAADLPESDNCYFYLYRGWWLPLKSVTAPYILHRESDNWQPVAQNEVVFQTGSLVVTRAKNPAR